MEEVRERPMCEKKLDDLPSTLRAAIMRSLTVPCRRVSEGSVDMVRDGFLGSERELVEEVSLETSRDRERDTSLRSIAHEWAREK